MIFDRQKLDNNELITIYKKLLFARIVEEKMRSLLKQGTISRWYTGMGGEAIAIGATMAMQPDEYILPMYHNLGVYTTRDVPVSRLMAQLLGKPSGFTRGRNGLFNFCSQEHKIIGAQSHLGAQSTLATGIALADILDGKNKATLVFAAEGSTSEGDFHEALNIAAVWNLPVIFLVENNTAALSIPNNEQYRCERLADKALGYGMEARYIDGNNVLEVYHAINDIAIEIRLHPRPVLVECVTLKMPLDDGAPISQELLDQWSIKGPVRNFEKYLLQDILSLEWVSYLKSEFTAKANEEVKQALDEPVLQTDVQKELADVFKPYTLPVFNYRGKPVVKRFAEAISDGLALCMDKYDNLVLFQNSGQSKITTGLAEKYGKARIKTTPDCESGIVGTAIGLALNGYKAIAELRFGSFVGSGFNQVVNNLAKAHYRRGQNMDVVLRIPIGINTNGFQTDVTEAWFTKTPGLKVVYPAFPADAKGLLMAAVDDPNPVVYFEHQQLYQNLTGEVPEGNWFTEIGKARVVKEGTWATIITYGMGVHWALEYVNNHPNYSVEVIDLRTLQPWDKETVEKSVAKTSRAMILHEDTLTGGFGGEIAAHIARHCFTKLDAPIMRCASLDTPVPMDKNLQKQFLPNARLDELMEELIRF